MGHRFAKTVAAVSLAATMSLAGISCGTNEFEAPPPPEVVVAQPSVRSVTTYATFTGSTQAADSSDIRARVGGILEEIRFDNGSPVSQGDVLFVVDQQPFIAARDAAAAQLESAKAQQALAEATAARIERSARDGAVTQLQADEARAQAEVAAAAVEVAEKQLAIKQLDVDDSEIKAPRAGLIQKASVEEGDLISAGGQTLLATIYDDTTIDVWFSVPDRVYLRAVRNTPEGAPPTVGVRTELDDDFPFSGEIEYADPVADELTGTIRIRASVDNPDRTLLGGLFVRVRIPTGQLDEAVLVPEAAVLRDQVGPYVLVVGEGNVVERRNVELGATDAGDVIVTSGLAAEDRLVTRGLLRARPGAPVTPKTEPPSESPTTSPAE